MRLTNKCPTRSLAILRFALPAQVVKLVDTLASGASARKGVEVQVLSWAPNISKVVYADVSLSVTPIAYPVVKDQN